MKKILAILLGIIGTTAILVAQEKMEDQKKVYRSEDNKLYINKDQGVYLWISTSPDDQSEKIRLQSDSSKRYTNPMYFDTEGYNTVRSPSAVDTSTRRVLYPIRDIIFEVYADGLPPVSQSTYRSDIMRTISGKKYYGNDLTISIKSRDAVSGVQNVYYILNSMTNNEYTGELKGFQEGENLLRYYAVDKVGNIEKTKEEAFYIDKAPPKTTYSIEGNKSEKYVSAQAKIKLESADTLSGVKAIYYKVDNGTYRRYINPIPVSVLKSDEAAISFYAEDNLGNKENSQIIGGKNNPIILEGASQNMVFEFYVDNDPPEVKVELSGDSYSGKYTYISRRTKINVSAEDEKAGVEKILYSFNSTLIDQEYNESVSLEKEGLQYFRVKAADYVGNTSPVQVKSYYGDFQPPISTLNVGSPKFSSRDTLFITSKSKISIDANDTQSGLNGIYYSINQDSSKSYSEPIFLKQAGSYEIVYGAVDMVNNIEKKRTLEAYVDDLPPIIQYNFSVESIGTKTVREEIYTIYPTNAMLYLSATDARSGSDRIEYSVNGGASKTMNPVKGFVPGNYLVKVKAFDVLGNQSEEVIKFAIEK